MIKKETKIFLVIFGVLALLFLAAMIFENNLNGNTISGNTITVGGDSNTDKIAEDINKIISYGPIKSTLEVFAGETYEAKNFLAKIILMFILFGVVYTVLEKSDFFDRQWILIIISIAVPILAIRFLENDWINAIILPYSTFGVAVASLIPLVIYFYFVRSIRFSTGRKIAWIFAAVVFIGLYFTRRSELGDAWWVYPIAAIACLILLWKDGTIDKAWKNAKYKNLQEIEDIRNKTNLIAEIRELDRKLMNNEISQPEYDTLFKGIQKKAKILGHKKIIPKRK
ncbi:MAG: hypothetical protein Q8N88_01255 [Nanoarchaeota archaeon]|nr:hypothetical protein [Nanoarchaeota archaeon]